MSGNKAQDYLKATESIEATSRFQNSAAMGLHWGKNQ